MRNTIKLKIQIAIAVIIAIVSGVQAWVSVNQLHEETTSTLNREIQNISESTNRYISDWLSIRSDMMLANEQIIAGSDDADRELLLTKRAGNFSLFTQGSLTARLPTAIKANHGHPITTLELALGIKTRWHNLG